MSEKLIHALAADVRPVSRFAVARRLVLGAAVGAAISAVLTAIVLGLRPDMDQAVLGGMFWVKLGYALTLGGIALWACERLTRPAASARGRIPWLLAPLLVLSAFAAAQLAQAPAQMRLPMMMGHSARVCPWLIVVVGLAPLLGLVWAVRGLAPTRLRLTGLMVGLAAGGVGAAVYALHCDESTAPFLAIWYTLGMAGWPVVGWLAGPRVLRW